VVRGQRVVTPEGVGPASIHIQNGRISLIARPDEIPSGCPLFDADHSVVMPGLVDTHVHINEPGRTDWEGFASATRAAAAGGVTTLVDMPLNCVPATTSSDALQAKLAAAKESSWVDVGFWGGVVPGNVHQLRGLFNAGVVGFKCFLVPSGVDEFCHVTESDLRAALRELAGLGAVLIVHAELPGPLDEALRADAGGRAPDPRRYATFLSSRPRKAEDEAVALIIRESRQSGCRVHVVHHSSADALPILRRARADGVKITVETCPHYLCLAAEDVPDGATEFKCCPPIRERENAEELWAALREGLIEMVVSDHSPCPPGMKFRESGDFMAAWGGISSLELRLPLMWTAAERRRCSLENMTLWLSHAPARLVGLHNRKGAIRTGYDADLVVWNPEAPFRVDAGALHQRHKLTPYAGQVLRGVVEATFLRGQRIYANGRFSEAPLGVMLLRGRSDGLHRAH
jgi:allantoinase